MLDAARSSPRPDVSPVPHNEDTTEADTRLLEFEDAHPKQTGVKTDAILHTFGMTLTTYYRRIHRLAHNPDVVAAYPMLAKRVQKRAREGAARRAALTAVIGR